MSAQSTEHYSKQQTKSNLRSNTLRTLVTLIREEKSNGFLVFRGLL